MVQFSFTSIYQYHSNKDKLASYHKLIAKHISNLVLMESGFNVTDKKRDTPLKKVRIKCDRLTDRHDMTYNYTYVTANLDI